MLRGGEFMLRGGEFMLRALRALFGRPRKSLKNLGEISGSAGVQGLSKGPMGGWSPTSAWTTAYVISRPGERSQKGPAPVSTHTHRSVDVKGCVLWMLRGTVGTLQGVARTLRGAQFRSRHPL
eukprot:8133882-Pyramimonas_sp.AAC.1